MSENKTGIELIELERIRQVTQEGWSAEHDDRHGGGELADAALCYITAEDSETFDEVILGMNWPWHTDWWKPSDRIRNLTKAGALIAAEIDRLQRKV